MYECRHEAGLAEGSCRKWKALSAVQCREEIQSCGRKRRRRGRGLALLAYKVSAGHSSMYAAVCPALPLRRGSVFRADHDAAR